MLLSFREEKKNTLLGSLLVSNIRRVRTDICSFDFALHDLGLIVKVSHVVLYFEKRNGVTFPLT